MAAAEKLYVCRFDRCGQVIDPMSPVVRTSAGPMHAACYDQFRELVEQQQATAVAEGRHGPSRHLCDGCRCWVDSIFHITLTKKRLCPACSEAAGVGPEAYEQQLQAQRQLQAWLRGAPQPNTPA